MPASTPAERSLAGSIAAHERWGREPDRTAATAPGRSAFEQKFWDAADGDPVRAAHLRSAYFKRLALKSAVARRTARAAVAAAEAAEAELHEAAAAAGEVADERSQLGGGSSGAA